MSEDGRARRRAVGGGGAAPAAPGDGGRRRRGRPDAARLQRRVRRADAGGPRDRGRLRQLLAAGDVHLFVAGEPPVGLALVYLRPSVWSERLDAYLQELYVIPELRGRGIGRALLEATMEAVRAAGADHIDLNTGETDTGARSLYESSGFTNREGSPEGPAMLYYERDL